MARCVRSGGTHVASRFGFRLSHHRLQRRPREFGGLLLTYRLTAVGSNCGHLDRVGMQIYHCPSVL
eukprot:scaffold67235_cov61-Phaeocystis_antarctica.AAC.2